MAEHFFAPCPRGLEGVLATELQGLGALDVRAADAGVEFAGDMTTCWRANLESRVASRILWCRKKVSYRTEDDVYKAVLALPWTSWFSLDRTIAVHVDAIRCPLKSLDFITLRIKDAVCDAFRAEHDARPSVDTQAPDIRIHAFLDAHELTLYLDTSGDALFRRGERPDAGAAPLKKNLAAGAIYLSGWQPGEPFLDPMCGSGTFLVEAAQRALDIPPGTGRGFGFEKFTGHDAAAWGAFRAAREARARAPEPLPIYGSDLYGSAVTLAREHLAACGLADVVTLKQANVLEISAPAESGVIVTNPPYGTRMGELHELAEWYPRVGDTLKRAFAGWRAYILTADMRLPKLIGLSVSRRTPLFNGALECRLFEYRIVSGSMRREKPPRPESA